MKKVPLDLVYKMYKAKPGDIIDNTYVRMHGGWFLEGGVQPADSNKVFSFAPIYQFTLKDLSDGTYYYATQSCAYKPGYNPNQPYNAYFLEPFVSSRDPFELYTCEFKEMSVNTVVATEDPPV